MKGLVISLSGALLIAGCSGGDNEQQQIENAVRAQLAEAGTVTQVEMSRRNADEYGGFAVVQGADGHETRVNCTMRRNGSRFSGVCGQVIDQRLIDQVQTSIREQLAAQGLTVTQVQMARRDDDTLAGHAMVRDASGNQGQINCTSSRNASDGRFGLNCEGAEDAAPPAGPDQPGAEEPEPAEAEAQEQ